MAQTAFRWLIYFYLVLLLVLSLLPLTGYYAALGTLPILGYYLYRRFILEENTAHAVVTRRVFLFACLVFLFGFVLNMFCSLYTTYRMAEFRAQFNKNKKSIESELRQEAQNAEASRTQEKSTVTPKK